MRTPRSTCLLPGGGERAKGLKDPGVCVRVRAGTAAAGAPRRPRSSRIKTAAKVFAKGPVAKKGRVSQKGRHSYRNAIGF